MDGTFQIPLKRKYLSASVKKLNRKGDNIGRKKPNKNGLPCPLMNPPRHNRHRVLFVEGGTGKRRWRWI